MTAGPGGENARVAGEGRTIDGAPPEPGWYPDPWGVAPWRWWDGMAWTANVQHVEDHKPRLPSWLSLPVIIGGLLTLPFVVSLTFDEPLAVLLGLVPLLIVLPVLWWLDRVEPEPLGARIHSVLWGATVAGIISGTVNTIVEAAAGTAVAAVVSAPLIEEATKGLGIAWALRRREIDSVIDGIVYAGWVALGFAVVENFLYFANAAQEGFLAEVFVLRALLTPFAHPLFTSWIGLAIGIAVVRRQSALLHGLWGYALAVLCHAAWNGSLTFAEETGNGAAALAIAALCFVALFVAVVVTLFIVRRRHQRRFVDAVPMLASKYGIPAAEAQVFSNWRHMLATRRRLNGAQRHAFDNVHAALARLAELHDRPTPVDPVDEQRLADQLTRARLAAATT